MSSHSLDLSILRLCAQCGPGQTLCPLEAARDYARAIGADGLAWRDYAQAARSAAVRLAREGAIVLYRDGRLLDPDLASGGYRMGPPRCD